MGMRMIIVGGKPTLIGGYYTDLLESVEEFDGSSWSMRGNLAFGRYQYGMPSTMPENILSCPDAWKSGKETQKVHKNISNILISLSNCKCLAHYRKYTLQYTLQTPLKIIWYSFQTIYWEFSYIQNDTP